MKRWEAQKRMVKKLLENPRLTDEDRAKLDRLLTEIEADDPRYESWRAMDAIQFRVTWEEKNEMVDVESTCQVCGKTETRQKKRMDAWEAKHCLCEACQDDQYRPEVGEINECRACGSELSRKFFDDDHDFEYGLCSKCMKEAERNCKLRECDRCGAMELEDDMGYATIRRQTRWEPEETVDLCCNCIDDPPL